MGEGFGDFLSQLGQSLKGFFFRPAFENTEPPVQEFGESPLFQDTLAHFSGLTTDDLTQLSGLDRIANRLADRPDQPSFVPPGIDLQPAERIVFNPERLATPGYGREEAIHEAGHVFTPILRQHPRFEELRQFMTAARDSAREDLSGRGVPQDRWPYWLGNEDENIGEALVGAITARGNVNPNAARATAQIFDRDVPGTAMLAEILQDYPPYNRR